MPESVLLHRQPRVTARGRVNLLHVQAAMLIAAKKISVGEQAFAFRQMYTTLGAAHHILAFNGRRLFMCFFLPLFQSAPITPYCQKTSTAIRPKKSNLPNA